MNFIEEFKKIGNDLEKVRNKDNNEYEKDIYEDKRYNKLNEYLRICLLESLNKEQNAKDLVDNMDTVFYYTNYYNMDWLNYEVVYKHPNFIEKFINNISNFRFKKYISDLFDHLNKNDEDKFNIKNIFSDKMLEFLIKERLSSDIYNMLFHYMSDNQKQKFLELSLLNDIDLNVSYLTFYLTDKNKEYITNNISYFIKNCNIFDFMNYYDKDNKTHMIIKKYIENNPIKLTESMLNIQCNNNEEYRFIKEFTLELVKDICNSEKINISDIKRGMTGSFSRVFFIGNKVLKIGGPRATYTFPNNPYILTPLLRKEITLSGLTRTYEVTEKVDTNNIDENELYDLYKKIRDLGLIWTDVKLSNVGRLLKDNIIHWKEDIKPSDKTLGLDNKIGNTVLKAGNIVIIDDDFIYREGDKKIFYPSHTLYDEFEAMYQAEKAKSIKILEKER